MVAGSNEGRESRLFIIDKRQPATNHLPCKTRPTWPIAVFAHSFLHAALFPGQPLPSAAARRRTSRMTYIALLLRPPVEPCPPLVPHRRLRLVLQHPALCVLLLRLALRVIVRPLPIKSAESLAQGRRVAASVALSSLLTEMAWMR